MDRALLRPGRFGNLLYVPLPSPDERGMILKALAREMPIDPNVDLVALGKASSCDNLSGADLCAVVGQFLALFLKKNKIKFLWLSKGCFDECILYVFFRC